MELWAPLRRQQAASNPKVLRCFVLFTRYTCTRTRRMYEIRHGTNKSTRTYWYSCTYVSRLLRTRDLKYGSFFGSHQHSSQNSHQHRQTQHHQPITRHHPTYTYVYCTHHLLTTSTGEHRNHITSSISAQGMNTYLNNTIVYSYIHIIARACYFFFRG